jgi:ElaB/YqjD/DUF883 family membrane-anchored ribosome-binding protein
MNSKINGGTTMKAEVLEKVTDVRAAAAQLGAEAGRVKEVVADAVEDGINAAKRAVKQGRRAAEGFIDDAEHQVRRNPLSAIGVSFGIGLGLGIVIGALTARNSFRF